MEKKKGNEESIVPLMGDIMHLMIPWANVFPSSRPKKWYFIGKFCHGRLYLEPRGFKSTPYWPQKKIKIKIKKNYIFFF